jgi:hypothetical protein
MELHIYLFQISLYFEKLTIPGCTNCSVQAGIDLFLLAITAENGVNYILKE